MKNHINSPVSITAIRFGRNMQPIPRRMEWGGRTYHFIDQGIRVISRHGETVRSTFTMSDGRQNFRLQQRSGIWTLLGVY